MKKYLPWIAQGILLVMFLFFGVNKFFLPPEMAAAMFGSIGGSVAQYFTGVWEVASAILVIIPATAMIGAIMIIATMIVALGLHLTVLGVDPAMMSLAVVAIALSVFVIKTRRGNAFWSKK